MDLSPQLRLPPRRDQPDAAARHHEGVVQRGAVSERPQSLREEVTTVVQGEIPKLIIKVNTDGGQSAGRTMGPATDPNRRAQHGAPGYRPTVYRSTSGRTGIRSARVSTARADQWPQARRTCIVYKKYCREGDGWTGGGHRDSTVVPVVAANLASGTEGRVPPGYRPRIYDAGLLTAQQAQIRLLGQLDDLGLGGQT